MVRTAPTLDGWGQDQATTESVSRKQPSRLRGRVERGHVLMVVCGILAALLVARVMRVNQESVAVAVASRDIAAGAAVSADAVSWVNLPARSALAPTLATPADINVPRPPVAAVRLRAGEPIRRGDLGGGTTSDQRAMSIPVAPEHAAGGQLAEGDRVDVIAPSGAGSAFVLRGAPVLAVPPRPKGPATLADAGSGNYFVVVGVGPDDALRLATAVREGKIEVLRSTGAADVAGRVS